MTWYSDGTIALTNGNSSVVGLALSFTAAGIKNGDALVVAGARVEIQNVIDATHLNLAKPWAGSTDGIASYHIEPIGLGHYGTSSLEEKTVEYIELFKLQNKNFVVSKSLTTPPVSPSIGERHIVAVGATGPWQDQDNNYARWEGNHWRFDLPGGIFGGVWCWVQDEAKPYIFDSVWKLLPGTKGDTGVGIPPNGSIGQIIEKTAGGTQWVAKREILTNDRDYFVDPVIGLDTNSGLTSAVPFKTFSRAVSEAFSLDASIYRVTINIADGVHTEVLIVSAPMIGSQPLRIRGNTFSPQNTILNGSTAAVILGGANVLFDSLETRGAVHGINIQSGSQVSFGANVRIGQAGAFQIFCQGGTVNTIGGSYKIVGGAAYHYFSNDNGKIIVAAATITIGNPVSIGVFAVTDTGGVIAANATNFVNGGDVTGSRYAANGNGIINTAGGGASFLPGSTAGSTDGFGVYK